MKRKILVGVMLLVLAGCGFGVRNTTKEETTKPENSTGEEATTEETNPEGTTSEEKTEETNPEGTTSEGTTSEEKAEETNPEETTLITTEEEAVAFLETYLQEENSDFDKSRFAITARELTDNQFGLTVFFKEGIDLNTNEKDVRGDYVITNTGEIINHVPYDLN